MDRSLATYETPLMNMWGYESEYDDNWDTDDAEIMEVANKIKARTHMSGERFYQIYCDVMNYFTRVESLAFRQYQRGEKKRDEFINNLLDYLVRHFPEMKDENDLRIMVSRINMAVFQFDVLQPLIDNEDISDIKVCGADDIRVRMKGKAYCSDAFFIDNADLYRFIECLGLRHDYDINMEPQTTFTDNLDEKYILRFVISSEMINAVDHPYLHIRKIPKIKVGFEVLKQRGMLDDRHIAYLKDRARNSRGMFISGPPGSGKTTVYNEWLEFLPIKDREPVVLQENDELFTNRPGFIFHHVVHGFNGRRITLRDLTQMALVEGVNQVLVGEAKGAEMRDVASILNTGGYISCSLHSNGAIDTIDRAVDMVMQHEDVKDEATAKKMLKGIDTIVYMADYKIQEIVEPKWNPEKKDFDYIWIYRRDLEK